MINRAGKIAYDWTNDETLKENTEAFFKYFLDSLRAMFYIISRHTLIIFRVNA